jgi:hypothetical protein
MKAYVQATRHLVYQLFDSFLALHRQGISALHLPEKDPTDVSVQHSRTWAQISSTRIPRWWMARRIHGISCSFFPWTGSSYSSSTSRTSSRYACFSVPCGGMFAHNSQDFFDITFCYFPISFKPPPNDPYGITAEDLKSALRKCMAASPYFAKLALPLFLEKYATAVGQSMVRRFVSCVSQHALKPIRRILCFRWPPVFRYMVEMLCANEGQSSGTVSRPR